MFDFDKIATYPKAKKTVDARGGVLLLLSLVVLVVAALLGGWVWVLLFLLFVPLGFFLGVCGTISLFLDKLIKRASSPGGTQGQNTGPFSGF